MDYVMITCLHFSPLLLEIIQHIISVMHLITNIYAKIDTQLYHNSFLPSVVVRVWNELAHTTRNVPSISTFKRSLNSTLIYDPLFYLDS